LAVDIGTTGIRFAHAEFGAATTPTVGRKQRPQRAVAPHWYAGGRVYLDPAPPAPSLAELHSEIRAAGDTVAVFGVVSDAESVGWLQAAGKIAQGVSNRLPQDVTTRLRGVSSGLSAGPSRRIIDAATHNWTTNTDLPAPTVIPTVVAAAQAVTDVINDHERVLVIDIGAVSARVGLALRAGSRFEPLGRARVVAGGGGDRVDFHIADLAMRADQRLNAALRVAPLAALESFFISVREAKHAFCSATRAAVRADINGQPIEVTIDRDWLHHDMAADMQLLAAAARQFLAARPRLVLLTGGGARLPFVADDLTYALRHPLEAAASNGLATGALKQLVAPPSLVTTTTASATRDAKEGTGYTEAPGTTGAGPRQPPEAPPGWTLAIDFGTTYTVAVVSAADGTTRPIDIEGQGGWKMPSAVVRDEDGILVVGREAHNQAMLYPTGYVATPKRLIGKEHKLLGGEPVAVVDLIAAVLKRCSEAARREQGGVAPTIVRLTHPASWSGHRLDVLRAAARAAGLGEVELIEEPVAAASLLPKSVAQEGKPIAIYDFGGGTFDAAVLRPTTDGFEVAALPGGRDPLGGEDIDDQIIDFLGAGPLGERPEWEQLMLSGEPKWQRHRADLRTRVREAKEALARQAKTKVWISAIHEDYQLTRAQLEDLVDDMVNATVAELDATITAAQLGPQDLGGIYLIGGSSQLSLVHEKIVRHFNIEPTPLPGDPKTVVAEGAATFAPYAPPPPAHRPCRLGANPAPRPGFSHHIEHRLSLNDDTTVVQSVPNRWPALDAFVIDQQQRAIQLGAQLGPADYGPVLGAENAVLIPTVGADGHQYWSAYQIVGQWAVHSSWPQHAREIEQIRVIGDPARRSPLRPPLEFVQHDGTEPAETLTVSTRVSKVAADAVTTRGCTEPIPDHDTAKWESLFLPTLIQRRPGIKVQPQEPTTFFNGLPCKVASYRDRGKRGRCWYGIVDGRGVNITVEAPVWLPAGTAMTLRDCVAVFP
jgi:molecular chaperone DnaK (HSP70)